MLVRNTDDICRKVKLYVRCVSGLKINLYSSVVRPKDATTVITESGSFLEFGLVFVQLSRSGNMDHLDLTIAKEIEKTESALRAV